MAGEMVAESGADAEHAEQPLAEAVVLGERGHEPGAVSGSGCQPGKPVERRVRVGCLGQSGEKAGVAIEPEIVQRFVGGLRVGEAAAGEPQRVRPTQLRPRHLPSLPGVPETAEKPAPEVAIEPALSTFGASASTPFVHTNVTYEAPLARLAASACAPATFVCRSGARCGRLGFDASSRKVVRVHEDEPDPIDEAHAHPTVLAHVRIGVKEVDVIGLAEFNQADLHRATSFVSNFGNWSLPADVAAALGAERGHVEWVHDTGELILIGGVPHAGGVAVDVPATPSTLAAGAPVALGGSAVVGRSDVAGMVRMYFNEETLPPGSRVAILGRIEHGPRVHEVLWGWHEHHGHADGWAWLAERLVQFNDAGGNDRKFA